MTRGARTAGKSVCLGALLLLVAAELPGQETGPQDEEASRLERAAERFEAEARILTLFDRAGKVTATVGDRNMYFTPALSPDGKRIAVIISDLEAEKQDLWVIHIASGERTRITAHSGWDTEWAISPAWSPDGTMLAYVGMRDGYEGVYRAAADGSSAEELLYRHPGANLWLGDWSPDGKLVSVSSTTLVESFLYVLPMEGDGEREISELLHKEKRLMAGSFSPDSALLSYRSEETGINEIYLWDLAAEKSLAQVSERGGLFIIRGSWRPESDELYYLAAGEKVTAARLVDDGRPGSVTLTHLFDVSLAVRPRPLDMSVTADGSRILISLPHSPKLEQVAVLDREGNVLQRLGEPGMWRNPTLSPDGSRVAVRAWLPETNQFDIWSFDLASGTHTPVTTDIHADNWPVWSPDGRQLAYTSQRDAFSRIYRKPADGSAEEQMVFEYEPGAFLNVTDWSADGNWISFNDGCWGVLYIARSAGGSASAGTPVMEWQRDEYQVAMARFSPDNRFIAYLTDEIEPDVFNLYVAPFDPAEPDGRVPEATPLRISSDEVLGMVSWRGDGKELYYLNDNWEVKAVEVTTVPKLESAAPQTLFKLPGPLPGEPRQWKSATPDGQRFVFVLTVPVEIG